MNSSKSPVGWFRMKGKVIQIIPKDDESETEAIQRVTKKYDYPAQKVRAGAFKNGHARVKR